MKKLQFLMLVLLVTAAVCQAQITEPGWYSAMEENVAAEMPTNQVTQMHTLMANGSPAPLGVLSGAVAIAETNTPEIQALADGLQHDPAQIFYYVHDHIRHDLYFGSKKGAALTLLEKSGNDFDQCALMVALLRASGYSDAGYKFGWTLMPYDDPYGYHRDLHHWLRLTLNNTNWNTTLAYLGGLFGKRGHSTIFNLGDNNTILIQRAWVTVTIGGTNYAFDPSFKVSEPIAGINLTNATGFSSNALATAAGGTVTGNSVSGLNEALLRGALNGYTTNYLNWLQSNSPNAGVKEILGGWEIIPATYDDYAIGNWFYTYDFGGTVPVVDWSNQPTNLMASLKISFAGTNYQWWLPQLQGQRVTLAYDTNGLAQIWQDDLQLLQKSTIAADTNVTLAVNHPYGIWDFTNNVLINGTKNDQTVTNSYQRTNATYNIMYGFEPDLGWLQTRQAKLEAYRSQGLSDTSRQITSETLNVMGLNWLIQTAMTEWMLAAQLDVLPHYDHRVGRMAQETGHGYYVDAYMQITGVYPAGGNDAANGQRQNKYFDMALFFGSALEHGLIEQLQSSNLVAASTVKMLQLASTNGLTVYLASSTNWTTGANIKNSLTGYDTATLNALTTYINTFGYTALLPQNGAVQIAGTGSWKGYGYEIRLVGTNGLVSDAKMAISGGYNGGYPAFPTPIDSYYVNQTGVNQPSIYESGPNFTFQPTSADPLDTADGTFQVEHTDLSLGQAEPRGITLSLYYNGIRRNSNPAGLSGGWIHNYNCSANSVAAPQAGLGGTTPAQMASMLAATTAAINYYNGTQRNAKNWLVTALIAKWGVDHLTKNGVSVNLGKESLQFVKQPNGIFTPPANCKLTLVQTNSTYQLTQRHGNNFQFDAAGRLTNIVDQYSQSLKLAYNSSNLVQTVTDWKNRTFTFNYTGSHLTSVSDNSTPSRTVSYGYSTAYNPQGDLISFTDAESKTSTYGYDTNHQITATYDALNQLVVSNIYNAMGKVATQYTQGDTNKTWRIFWTPFQVTEQNPAGARRLFLYDDQSRLTALFDQLNNVQLFYYDGQNHTVATLSPLGELTQYNFDGRHNITSQIDPLGFTNQFVYDSENNLTRSIDARGNPTTYGYNAQFSLTGQTNGAGDFVNYNFNSDGTLHTRTDAGGTATFGYDSYGQLNGITYPGGLGGESFVNSSVGDPTSHTDANANVTSFQYNARRQLTNSIAPTNVTAKVSFDAVGNVASTTDARGNVTSNRWSATQYLLATIFPATPQGVPVITNAYDSRDWLTRTVDPLQKPTLYTNDAAGRVIAVTDPVQRTTRFGYDADGRRIATTNAADTVTSQKFDARGGLLKLTDGAGHFSTRAYDATGNQIILTNRNGKKWQFQFDAANRLTNTLTPLNRQTAVTFDSRGLLKTVREPSGQMTTNFYDPKGRLTNRVDGAATTRYAYDANDNLTSVTNVGQASSLSQTYDAYNRVSSFKDVYGNLIQYRYDANGNVTNLIYPGGKTVAYAYDALNRMTNVTDWSGRKTALAYDLASHITSIKRPNGSYRTIGYDAAGQATNILEQMSNSLPIAVFRLNWDAAARAQWEFAAPLPHPATVPTRTMTYDDDNRLATVNGSSVTNDLDGNLTGAPLTNGTFVSYAYDARNRLTQTLNSQLSTNNCFYDPAGNRIGITSGTNATVLVVNPNAKLPQMLMRIKNGVTNYYIYGAGLLYQITETATATNTLTYHYDYRGSTVALSADSGVVTDRIEYSAYGLTTYRTGASDTPFLFNGRYGVQTDVNGLLYMRARYYNPYLCRFISADPSGFGGGLNHYAYANGNPVSLIDPFGLGALGENADYSWLLNQSPQWAIEASQYQPTPTYQALANMLPFAGDLVRGGVAAWDGDVATAEQASQGLLAQALGNLLTAGMIRMMPANTVQIFRTVDQNELPSVLNGTYGSSPSASGKYFALTQEGAQNVASAPMNAGQQMTMTSIRVPRSVFNQGYLFNDTGLAGPSIHFQQDFLPALYNSMAPIKIH